jgi:hypothetical protein
VKAIAAKDQTPRSLRHLALHRCVISQIGRPAWLSGNLAEDDFKDALLTGSISPVVLSGFNRSHFTKGEQQGSRTGSGSMSSTRV